MFTNMSDIEVRHDPGDPRCVQHQPGAIYTMIVHRCLACRTPCPEGTIDYEACFAPFRYCPVKGCGRTENDGKAVPDWDIPGEVMRSEEVGAVVIATRTSRGWHLINSYGSVIATDWSYERALQAHPSLRRLA